MDRDGSGGTNLAGMDLAGSGLAGSDVAGTRSWRPSKIAAEDAVDVGHGMDMAMGMEMDMRGGIFFERE